MIARNPAVNQPSTDPQLWLPYRRPLEEPALRLFCFPYAGGSASVFREWPEALPAGVELCAVQLPGRERRMAEAPYSRMEEIMEVLPDVVAPLLDRPYVLFGHSLGAKIAYELAHALVRGPAAPPLEVIASACHAPHLPPPNPVYDLPDAELMAEMRELGGTPPEVLANEELMELFLPLMRADFTIADTYRRDAAGALPVPLTAYGGSHDPEVPVDMVAAWSEHTTGPFRRRMFDGGHFFIHERRDEVLEALGRDLGEHL